jgi:hypothetical protein
MDAAGPASSHVRRTWPAEYDLAAGRALLGNRNPLLSIHSLNWASVSRPCLSECWPCLPVCIQYRHKPVQPDRLGNDKLAYSTAQHSTAQHSTAQHSTAQHSTAQHSTAWSAQHGQHSIAQPRQPGTAQHSSLWSLRQHSTK